jgi:hypothetical protein
MPAGVHGAGPFLPWPDVQKGWWGGWQFGIKSRDFATGVIEFAYGGYQEARYGGDHPIGYRGAIVAMVTGGSAVDAIRW